MINKIVAIQGNHPSKLNPKTDTSVFLANEIQKKNYRIFYYDPKDLSIINSKVIAEGFFIKFNYNNKKFYKILKKQNLYLTKNGIFELKFLYYHEITMLCSWNIYLRRLLIVV